MQGAAVAMAVKHAKSNEQYRTQDILDQMLQKESPQTLRNRLEAVEGILEVHPPSHHAQKVAWASEVRVATNVG